MSRRAGSQDCEALPARPASGSTRAGALARRPARLRIHLGRRLRRTLYRGVPGLRRLSGRLRAWMGSDPALYAELFSDPIYQQTVVNTVLFSSSA